MLTKLLSLLTQRFGAYTAVPVLISTVYGCSSVIVHVDYISRRATMDFSRWTREKSIVAPSVKKYHVGVKKRNYTPDGKKMNFSAFILNPRNKVTYLGIAADPRSLCRKQMYL